ncbi:MAG: nucleotide pyrophosphohydrolase [bacterium]|jgi:predicted HAD superfamily Cof-like phosphohydrolase|nr:nucleotide pyrophosphohydrolase [bacterium]
MHEAQRMVREFHERFGVTRHDRPTWPGDGVHRLRMSLVDEEIAELRNAGERRDLIGLADALGDLLYVAYGTAEAYGIDLEPVFDEIHRSNMSKGDTEPRCRADGKVGKGERYSPPRVGEVLAAQLGRLDSPLPLSTDGVRPASAPAQSSNGHGPERPRLVTEG